MSLAACLIISVVIIALDVLCVLFSDQRII